MTADMPLARLQRGLSTYGADFRRWPPGEAAWAEAFCGQSVEAADALADAAALDALFALDRRRLADRREIAALGEGALVRIRRDRRLPVREWRWLFSRPVGAALAASLLAGWFLGFAAVPESAVWQMQGESALSALLGSSGFGGL